MASDPTFDSQGRYVAVTRGVTVRVKPAYLPRQSDPESGRHVWAYEVTIENGGSETVQLLNRHWRITDGHGRVEIVDGPGVVGEQPVLQPGQRHTYASGCPLPTPSGIMVGHYEMVNEKGERFLVEIPAFSLDLPGGDRAVN
ncbi:Co2+/Mg2+ efflux protein ApaG [Minwuia thermotolerans]|uniref:Protein ApaG n=1 Tax=Minwuia thermotolerans TaxID=2056226 RepID=A0A2M9G0Y7_9PROT|nr:Co2+/Mg2+ efflux protein ApaG [Minwuia thermotolerans]PJK29380.1 Co2+/Mg2+ efflux protein ApaG [Minwuia thermotolerans]